MNFSKFEQKILKKVREIPSGKISTYKEIARAVGNGKAARAVGNVLNKNMELIKIPCHRVVKSDSSLGGYQQGVVLKGLILEKEGILINKDKIVNFNKILYKF